MLKANDPLIQGIEFTIGGDTYIAPPLTLGGVKAVVPHLTATVAELTSVLLCVSLKRNYPEVTQPWIDSNMTGMEFRSSEQALLKLMSVSGLVTTPTAASDETNPSEDALQA